MEIRNPERGRKHQPSRALEPRITIWRLETPKGDGNSISCFFNANISHLEIRNPERGRKQVVSSASNIGSQLYLEIRNPERGRKQVD